MRLKVNYGKAKLESLLARGFAGLRDQALAGVSTAASITVRQ